MATLNFTTKPLALLFYIFPKKIDRPDRRGDAVQSDMKTRVLSGSECSVVNLYTEVNSTL